MYISLLDYYHCTRIFGCPTTLWQSATRRHVAAPSGPNCLRALGRDAMETPQSDAQGAVIGLRIMQALGESNKMSI